MATRSGHPVNLSAHWRARSKGKPRAAAISTRSQATAIVISRQPAGVSANQRSVLTYAELMQLPESRKLRPVPCRRVRSPSSFLAM
jgi:hypothetical protein